MSRDAREYFELNKTNYLLFIKRQNKSGGYVRSMQLFR